MAQIQPILLALTIWTGLHDQLGINSYTHTTINIEKTARKQLGTGMPIHDRIHRLNNNKPILIFPATLLTGRICSSWQCQK